MNSHHKINYIEIPVKNIEKTKNFFTSVFQWSFNDFGPDYSVVLNGGIDCGFFKSELTVSANKGSPLIVIYSNNLELSKSLIIEHGGKIIKPIFQFPGGHRLHFTDVNGNEFAVWSDNHRVAMINSVD